MIQENPNERPKFANFFEDLTACFGNLNQFEQKIQQIAEIAGIDLSQFEIDHLAVRMNTEKTAHLWREMLLGESQLLKESEVNGRPIALFHLHHPLRLCHQSVSVIELPFPKGKTYPQEGWEHIEIVLPFLRGENVEQWIERVCKRFDLVNNLQLRVKISQPSVAGERLPNPSIALSLNSAVTDNPYCLKLHPYAITDIIRSEVGKPLV